MTRMRRRLFSISLVLLFTGGALASQSLRPVTPAQAGMQPAPLTQAAALYRTAVEKDDVRAERSCMSRGAARS